MAKDGPRTSNRVSISISTQNKGQHNLDQYYRTVRVRQLGEIQ